MRHHALTLSGLKNPGGQGGGAQGEDDEDDGSEDGSRDWNAGTGKKEGEGNRDRFCQDCCRVGKGTDPQARRGQGSGSEGCHTDLGKGTDRTGSGF
jgi:hypothetical protein